jgi:hypothetical protein
MTDPGASGWRSTAWWSAVLFIVGSACFAIGPFPGFVQLVGAVADAAVFFAGSLCFTAAAALQVVGGGLGPRGLDWWAGVVQLAGTVFFNISTFAALQYNLSTAQENRLIWAPDVFGCVCFLVASGLAWAAAQGWINGINLAGSVAFGIAGVASFFVPDTGDVLDLAAANFTTAIGALCFLAGAVGMLADERRARIPAERVPTRQ